MIGYSVAPDDQLLVGEYDPDELLGMLEERDVRILRRYVQPMLTPEGRIIVLLPLSVYARSPEAVVQVMAGLVALDRSLWPAIIEGCRVVTDQDIDSILGSDSGEEW